MMKKITILGTILILLAFLVVPAMAKSPANNNGNGNSEKGNTPAASAVVDTPGNGHAHQNQEKEQNQHAQANQHSQNNQEQEKNQERNTNGNQGSSRMRTPFYLQGTITAIDTTAMTMTVSLTHGNAQVKNYIGGELGLQVSETTQIFKINQMNEDGSGSGESSGSATADGEDGPNRVPITFDQLAVGDIVAIHGNLQDGVFNATLVTVYVRSPEGEPVGGEG
jgi:hypothetical protein